MASQAQTMGRIFSLVSGASESDWEALYERELPRIYNFFRFRVGDGPVAEDLTSLTFEKAWAGRRRYRKDLGAFSTWLYAIARNVAIDHYRRAHREVALDTAHDVVAHQNPERDAVQRSDFERLEELLEGLPDRERELVSMKYGAEMTNREIARLTGLSESNIGTILHRTVTLLRERW